MDPFHHLNSSFSNPYHPLLAASPPHHFDPLLDPPPPPPLPGGGEASIERERLPQWSHAETAAFLAIRADLDDSFLSTKRNKALWESASARLHSLGFSRTPDQCKSKWKNLVTRFKGTAAAATPAVDPTEQMMGTRGSSTSSSSFPFHDELRRIFESRAERARALDQMRKKVKGKDQVDDEDDQEDDDDDGDQNQHQVDEDDDAAAADTAARAKKRRRKAAERRNPTTAAEGEVEAMLREFMRRQVEMEERWMEAAEAREAERRDV
uniref:Myb-like domain-containing protein n=1 Tax=Leersia perrieri TaxID=77586 RepID=A0A0D9WCA9_9ORYZ